MRIYVIGPVTGLAGENRPAFEDAAIDLERAGYSALIPHWFVSPGAEWQQAMRRSVETLVKCDGVAALEGFGRSRGARAEADLASAIGIPVKSVEAWVRGSAGKRGGGR